ncbi:MAG: class I SAM-dependent methyltransferase [Patescibacteria group bacterium]
MDWPYHEYIWNKHGFHHRDLTPTISYDQKYLDYYLKIDDKVREISAQRAAVLAAFVKARGKLLDFGCGIGRFIEAASASGWDSYGCDLVPPYDKMPAGPWEVVTFFDSLEHVPDPAGTIAALAPKVIMLSTPECHYPGRPDWFMNWKHRKPGEHLWHWNRHSLSFFLAYLGYSLLMVSNFEDDIRLPYDPELPNILTAIYRRK